MLKAEHAMVDPLFYGALSPFLATVRSPPYDLTSSSTFCRALALLKPQREHPFFNLRVS